MAILFSALFAGALLLLLFAALLNNESLKRSRPPYDTWNEDHRAGEEVIPGNVEDRARRSSDPDRAKSKSKP